MYIIPLIVILVLALAIFISPIFAVVLAVVFMAGLGVYKFLGRGIDPESTPAPNRAAGPPGSGSAVAAEGGDEDKGPWGEVWPEQDEAEEPAP